MSVKTVHAKHFQVVCTKCQRPADLCPQRDDRKVEWATGAFKKANWRLDVHHPTSARDSSVSENEAQGVGRWYCPACVAEGVR